MRASHAIHSTIALAGLTALALGLIAHSPRVAGFGAPLAVDRDVRDVALPPATPVVWTPRSIEQGGSSHSARFEENQGQFNPRVRFMTRGAGFLLFLNATEATYVLPFSTAEENDGARSRQMFALRMTIRGANPDARIAGERRLSGTVNYVRGHDPSKSATDVPTFSIVRIHDVYAGVDLLWYGNETGTLEYDFEVAAGCDPSTIELEFTGATKVEIASSGELLLHTRAGVLRQARPVVYQPRNGARDFVSGRYELRGENRVGFVLGQYDRRNTLVIDPNLGQLAFSSYLGGSGLDFATGIAVDSARNVYVTGFTLSIDFPTATGSFDTSAIGARDVFVTKMNAAATTALYSTYIGGSSDDEAAAVAVDPAGRAYVVGSTRSSDFPVTVGAFDTSFNGNALRPDAFVLQLNGSGSALGYSTYLGGTNTESAGLLGTGLDIDVDASGNAYVTGATNSANFPVTAGAFDTTYNGGFFDIFVTKLNSTGTGLVYSTFLGGSADEDDGFVAISVAGTNALVTGGTESSDFPTTSGAFDTTHNGGTDVFVTLLNPTGSAVSASTFLGGTSNETGTSTQFGPDGRVYVAGHTTSVDFPVPGAGQGDDLDGFVIKLPMTLASLMYFRSLGGDQNDAVRGLAVTTVPCSPQPCIPARLAVVTGSTTSTDFPLTPDAFDSTPGFLQGSDAFVTRLTPAGGISYSTFLGGGSAEDSFDIAVDSTGNVYVTGMVDVDPDLDFPVAGDSVLQKGPGGSFDGFVSKLGEYVVSGRILNANGAPMAGVTVIASEGFSAARQTDAQGFYFFDAPPTGSYRITPNQPGLTFTPPFRRFVNPQSNRVADFVGQ